MPHDRPRALTLVRPPGGNPAFPIPAAAVPPKTGVHEKNCRNRPFTGGVLLRGLSVLGGDWTLHVMQAVAGRGPGGAGRRHVGRGDKLGQELDAGSPVVGTEDADALARRGQAGGVPPRGGRDLRLPLRGR
jgi:hypothetical protein